eukprot:1497063-Amphidinium_carterae.2
MPLPGDKNRFHWSVSHGADDWEEYPGNLQSHLNNITIKHPKEQQKRGLMPKHSLRCLHSRGNFTWQLCLPVQIGVGSGLGIYIQSFRSCIISLDDWRSSSFLCFNANLYEARWNYVHDFIVELDPLVPLLEAMWSEMSFTEGTDSRFAAAGNFDVKEVTRLLADPMLRAYNYLMLTLGGILRRLTSWLESCPCHGTTLSCANETKKPSSRRGSEVKVAGEEACQGRHILPRVRVLQVINTLRDVLTREDARRGTLVLAAATLPKRMKAMLDHYRIQRQGPPHVDPKLKQNRPEAETGTKK